MELSRLRSLLFAPASEERKLRKALASEADAVIADLEDGVAPGEKEVAREVASALFTDAETRCRRVVRVNPPDTDWFEADVELVRGLTLDAVMLPKATPDAVAVLGDRRPVIAIVETAAGLRLAYETACSGPVFVLALGTHDLGADLRTTPRPDALETLYARSKVVVDSAAAGIRAPLDTPYVDVRDPEGLERECVLARSLGYRGKLCIHPDQLEAVNRVFAPTEAELDWARRVLEAYEQGVAEGRGAIVLDGRMVDMPIVKQARQLLAEERT